MTDILPIVARADPSRATELELLYGIKKWTEYATGRFLIGVILLVIIGTIGLSLLMRLPP